ncbi:MAG: cysteine--1-D-myo-inosityl 2-amino-2-deoxy-alpha-D-glucopyranoside ligase [Propionibacteriaceae bacterium]|jgi:L-cysteine:1D-myo-inositol 2-amino-2-deoxy-alpha-D-glucopyranoside ligase|nr:cysteine--1-D-myo-inosityl 2-amino-2-deoxy-alpha-D-glucopyranoside ligase [Propionibacteriaceae bacterium]
MQAWSHPGVPQLFLDAARPQVIDTRTERLLTVGPESGEARLYACGITPYDATHLGHAFTYVQADLLHRAWLTAGLGVHYVQNVTDVDDPLLERAAATGVDWRELADGQVELFRADMAALRVIPPREYRGVVEEIERVIDAVQALIDAGAAYQVDDPAFPDWYFDSSSLVSRPELVALFAERGGDPERAGKRHPLDSLLWRLERAGEPAWDAPFGRGRPGWHIECAAISTGYLGKQFDVQAGGVDLAFPHHPMCAAQAQALTGEPFAKAYFHVGMVALDGEKMSKSKGNLVFVSQLRAVGVDPMAIRLLLLGHQHREDWEYFSADLDDQLARLRRWRAAFARPQAPEAEPVIAAISQAICDDLDSPSALALVDEWASRSGNSSTAAQALATAVDAMLGVHP